MKSLLFALGGCLLFTTTNGQSKTFYTTTGADGAIFSFATVENAGEKLNNVIRFAPVFNFGSNVHFDAGNTVGFYSGIHVKNLGFIHEDISPDTRWKRRVYTMGVPLAVKVGNMTKENYFFFGAMADFAFHYKEKKFVNGEKEAKKSEFFGNQTPFFMPAFFAGLHVSQHLGLKAQYYPNNFFNQDYRAADGTKPFQNLNANIFYLTLGYDVSFSKRMNKQKPAQGNLPVLSN